MISKNLLSALEGIGFQYYAADSSAKCHAYAIYGGYLVSAYEDAGKKVAYFNFKFSDGEENASKRYSFSESFSARMDEFSITDYSLAEDGLKVVAGCGITDFLRLIDSCVALLIENEIDGALRCSVCGNKFGTRNPKKVTFGCDNRLMCEHCAFEALEDHNKEEATQAPAKSDSPIVPGVLGSVLFSLLGVGLYFVFYYFISPAIGNTEFEVRYIFSALGFAVALLAYVGYRAFCKKVSMGVYVTVPVCAVVFSAIGQYIGVVFEFLKKGGFAVSNLSNKSFWLVHVRSTVPDDVVDNFVSFSGKFYVFLTISLLFAIVGSAIFLLSLREKSMKKKDPLVIETIKIN